MKTKICSIIFAAFILACIIFIGGCKSEHTCPNPNTKVYLEYKDQFVPYKGNDTIKFLHNNMDTQIFIGQVKISYFINDNSGSGDACSKDHESTKINFINNTSKDTFLFKYEFDNALFPFTTNGSPYTSYKFTYKNKFFYSIFYDSKTSIIYINSHPYNYVWFIGSDTSNCVVTAAPGIVSIRVNNENWDLIP